MSPKLLQAAILTVSLCLTATAPGQAGAQTSSESAPKPTSTKAAKPRVKLPLTDITLVSTAEAAREAAKATEVKGKSASDPHSSKSQASANSGVMEFQPANPGSSAGPESGGVQLKDHKKSVLKDIHGTAYGSTSAQGTTGRTAGGAIGAGSSNGKFNVFVETQRSQASTPAPH